MQFLAYDIRIFLEECGAMCQTERSLNQGELVLSATEAGMWVDYLSTSNPTKDGTEAELKHAWVVRYDGVIIGSG